MTADPRPLARFSVEGEGDVYLLVLEDTAGGIVRLTATEEQLDVLADLIDDALGTGTQD